MIRFIIIFLTFLIYGCSKPKTVFICGDHVCINKNEAKQYFEENLSLEVKILSQNKQKEESLIELNLNNNTKNRKIHLVKKDSTKKELKELSKVEYDQIKKEIKEKKVKNKNLSKGKLNVSASADKKRLNRNINKVFRNSSDNIDVCTILEKCNIEEISKYLIKLGKYKKFPDITIRE